jgi:ribonuclease HI
MAEVWGLYEGLLMARNLGIERLEVQVDSEASVKATGYQKRWIGLYHELEHYEKN